MLMKIRRYLVLLAWLVTVSTHADIFVIVHGGWAGGYEFKAVDQMLTEQGHTVYRPTLTGLGERVHLARPDTSLETHIQDVVNLIEFESLRHIILVGHSYGGMVVTGVADRIPDRLCRVVYIEGLVPVDGESVLDIHSRAAKAFPKLRRGNVVLHPRYESDAPHPSSVPQPVRTVTDKIRLSGAGSKVPTQYFLTVEAGKTAESDVFYPQAQRARALGWPVIKVSGDHNIQRSAPALLAALIVSQNQPNELCLSTTEKNQQNSP